jgi:deoxycytidine triphosphate deaminase
MAYLGTELLKKLIQEKNVISPAPKDFNRVKSGAYELSLGNEVFRTDSKDKKKEILKDDKEQVTINPGQFALLLTEEELNIPKDIIAFISIKAKIKLRGLINVSGFHVDPGFKGKLVFSVYNAGTSPISLEKGEPYFLIWFAELKLSDKETETYNGEHKNQNSIPLSYIDALKAGELASPNELSKRIDALGYLKTKIEWVVLAILTLSIGLSVKFWSDSSKLKDAVDYGYTKKINETSNDSLNKINQVKIDSLKVELQSVKETLEKIGKK